MIAGALVNGITPSAFHVGTVTENAAIMALAQATSPDAPMSAIAAVPLLHERLRPGQALGLVLDAPPAWPWSCCPAGSGAGRVGRHLARVCGAIGLAAGTVYFRRFGGGAARAGDRGACGGRRPHGGADARVRAAARRLTLPAIAAVAWNVFAVSIGAMALLPHAQLGTHGRVAANFYLIPDGRGAGRDAWGTLDRADRARLRHRVARGVPGRADARRRASAPDPRRR